MSNNNDILELELTRLQDEGFNILFSDVNALLSVLTSLTQDYRLLVGAAEEFNRTSAATPVLTIRATVRAGAAGELIDEVLKVLAIKLDFALDVLRGTELPLQLIFTGLDTARDLADLRRKGRKRREKKKKKTPMDIEEFFKKDLSFPEFRADLELEVDQDLDTEVDDELEFGGDDPRPED